MCAIWSCFGRRCLLAYPHLGNGIDIMRNIETNRFRYASAALSVLLCLTAQAANANSEYDSESLNGNLQHQCTQFSASLDFGNSLTVSAQCNKEEGNSGTAAASRQNTSFDLAEHVVWYTGQQRFAWNATRTDDNDITAKCTSVGGFSFSTTDVTLHLTCSIESTSGTPQTTNAGLPLNGGLTVGSNGELARR